MSRSWWRRRLALPALVPAAALAMLMVGAIPAHAVVTNPALGAFDPAAPGSNQYSGCVAAALTGDGFVFGSSATIGTELAALWPNLPTGLTSACRQAVQTKQPQVCVNPADPSLCPAVGAAAEGQLADQANSLLGTWKLIPDAAGASGVAQTTLHPADSGRTALATVTGTFTTPATFCDLSTFCTPDVTGLWTTCGPVTCGPVTQMTVSFSGRTPDTAGSPNGETAVLAHVHAVDGHGRVVQDGNETYGSNWTGAGCGGPEPHECSFNGQFGWNCTDAAGASANCGGQSLTVAFTFLSGWPGQPEPPATLGQQVATSLNANLLDWRQNPACPGLNDCLRFDDGRLAYSGSNGDPTVVDYSAAPIPAAVINLDPGNLDCLVGLNVLANPAGHCLDLTHAQALVVQAAHAPVAPPVPPSVAVTSVPAAGAGTWDSSPVTVTIQAKDESGIGIASVTYAAVGAQAIAQTKVSGSSATVRFMTEGISTLTYWATDAAGGTSPHGSLTVQLDLTAPTFSCAASDGNWHAGDVSLACTAADSLSGLAATSPAGFQLFTSVPAGVETANAATGTQQLCDAAGNCVTAGPIGGNRVDRKPPSITLLAPSGAYALGQPANADYACSDGGSSVATCAGAVPAGSAVDTSHPGSFTFSVTATDQAGNQSEQSSSYSVAFGICPLTGVTRGGHEDGTVLLRFRLCDSGGHNLSSSSIPVRATGLLQVATGAVMPVAGSVRFEYGLYTANLLVDDLPAGNYQLLLSAAGDPTTHSLPFTVSGEHDWGGAEQPWPKIRKGGWGLKDLLGEETFSSELAHLMPGVHVAHRA